MPWPLATASARGVQVGVLLLLAADVACSRSATPPDAGNPARVVPVVAATVERRDVAIWLDGLGTVVALKTVTVHTRVDGQLLDVRFRDGEHLHRGQLLALVDPRPFLAQLHQARGALARDAALLRDSRLNYWRYLHLHARNLVAKQNVDDQRALVGQYHGAVELDRAQIETARLNLRYARITCPIDGVAGLRLIDPGNVVHATDANGIVLVTQLDPIAALVSLPQDDLAAVAQALAQGPLAVELYSRDESRPLGAGRVEAIDNQINLTTATLRLKAVFANPTGALWPNQFVKARVRVGIRKDAIVVPVTAVQRGPSGDFAWVIGADGTVAMRKVQLDVTVGDLSILRSGLSPGERVVVEGQDQLGPGVRVSVRAMPDGGGAQ